MTINVQILGNLGADAELKEHEGTAYLSFNVASNNYRNKDEVTWIRCALWGSRAEKLQEYLTKGTRVLVTGLLTTREGDEGKTFLNCHADRVSFAGSSKDDDDRGNRRKSTGRSSHRSNDDSKRDSRRSEKDNDDDIPF